MSSVLAVVAISDNPMWFLLGRLLQIGGVLANANTILLFPSLFIPSPVLRQSVRVESCPRQQL